MKSEVALHFIAAPQRRLIAMIVLCIGDVYTRTNDVANVSHYYYEVVQEGPNMSALQFPRRVLLLLQWIASRSVRSATLWVDLMGYFNAIVVILHFLRIITGGP